MENVNDVVINSVDFSPNLPDEEQACSNQEVSSDQIADECTNSCSLSGSFQTL